MSKATMIGCDVHDSWMVLKVSDGPGEPIKKVFATSKVDEMIVWVKDFAAQRGAKRIVFAYEASGQGFGLYDRLTEAGIECHVLAPTHLPHTVHGRKNKTDDRDAQMILDEVRAHVLAGRKLPAVWVPDPQTRDDREAVRMRLELGAQRTRIKNQIRSLAKRSKLVLPGWFSKGSCWSRRSLQWLRDVAAGTIGQLGEGVRVTLNSLVDLYQELCRQIDALDKAVAKLAKSPRYAKAFLKLQTMPGVGRLSAMVFLTEIGDLNRFANRRQLAAYLGLAPAAFESGKHGDRKGHITRQGPARVRHVLCQAAWVAVGKTTKWRSTYENVRRGSTKRSKIAIVAVMRRLAVAMWQAARSPKLDKLLEMFDRPTTSARARQKGAAPSHLRHRLGLGGVKAEATAKAEGAPGNP